MKTTKDFRICNGKGFHIRLKNGWIISVQIGAWNYCDNYDYQIDPDKDIRGTINISNWQSNTAEVWAFHEDGRNYPENPLGYQTVEDLLEFISKVKRKKS